MEKTTTLNLRINQDVKHNAETVLSALGLSMTAAITIYLKQIALKNLRNESVLKQIADIVLKLTQANDQVDPELCQKFVGAKGHEAVIELLIAKDKRPRSVPLIKTLNNLCQVPLH